MPGQIFIVGTVWSCGGFAGCLAKGGILLRTEDWGITWSPEVQEYSLTASGTILNAVKLSSNGTLIMVGNGGYLSLSRQQGTWTRINTGIQKNLNALSFTGDTSAVIAGDSGTILLSAGASMVRERDAKKKPFTAEILSVKAERNGFLKVMIYSAWPIYTCTGLYDLSGKTSRLAAYFACKPGKNELSLDVSGISNGVYLIRAFADGMQAARKFIYQR
jgi:hypothetical protein